MVNAGWFDEKSMSVVLAMVRVYGGTAQAMAGILSYVRRNTFATVAFLSFGSFWISLVAYIKVFGGEAPAAFVGWYLFVWGVFTFYMWIATFHHNMALQLVFLTLWITFLLLAIGDWFGLGISHKAGGYLGLGVRAPCGLSLRRGSDKRRLRSDGPSDRAVQSVTGRIEGRTPQDFHGVRL